MFDILSKFNNASTGIVTESATATRSRSSSAGDPAMHDILSKFYGAVSEAGVDTSTPTGDKNKAFDKLDDTHFDQPTGDADVMATPSYGGYQVTKNMKTGDITQTYDNSGLRVSQSQNAQGDITRQSANYKMGDTRMSMAQAGDEKFADAEQIATGAGPGAYGSAYDAGDGNLQVTSIGQVSAGDKTATSVSSDASGNTNAYMSDRDTANMIAQQEKDIARMQTDKLFNDVNESEDPVDTVTMDVPLLIRMLEFAREDAKTDMDLHDVAEKLIALSANNGALTMSDYNAVVGGEEQMSEDENDLPASDEEASMAGDQAEYIKYAIDEIKDSIEAGNSFPEWFQNKLSGVYSTLKDLHAYMEGDKRNDADDEVMLSLEDVVSKKQAAADVVGKKTAVDDIVKELSKNFSDFIAQVEEERDDMSFFKKDKKR